MIFSLAFSRITQSLILISFAETPAVSSSMRTSNEEPGGLGIKNYELKCLFLLSSLIEYFKLNILMGSIILLFLYYKLYFS